jgi:hypothetical protein
MSRFFKVLPLALALAALGILAISCGSDNSQYRIVQAIPDSPVNFDIQIGGKTLFTNVGFGTVEPSSGYDKISSGSDPIEVFQTGTTTPVINSTALNLAGGKQYTVFLTGTFGGTPAATLVTDNNTAPTSGNVEFRIMDASPSAPGSVDIYIVPPGTDITGISPDISGLTFGQASTYVSKGANTYEVIVTTMGNKTPLISPSYTLTAGQIRTIVLVDIAGGGALNGTPLELNDLN